LGREKPLFLRLYKNVILSNAKSPNFRRSNSTNFKVFSVTAGRSEEEYSRWSDPLGDKPGRILGRRDQSCCGILLSSRSQRIASFSPIFHLEVSLMRLYLSLTSMVALTLGLVGQQAQAVANMLVNGDLEASPAFSYFDGVSSTDPNLVPGWTMFGDGPPDASSWVQVSYDAVGNTIDLDLAGSETSAADSDFIGLSGIKTAVASRPAVSPGASYIASVTYDNYFTAAGISYFIDWFDVGGSLIGSAGGPLGDPNGPFVYAPYSQLFQVAGTAPAGAVAAGVRFQSSNDGFSGAAADNFRLVPEPGAVALCAFALSGLVAMTRCKRS
jgi:hypothetical protein